MIVAVIQARSSSTRLPGKVMREILGRPMLAWLIQRVARAERVDRVVLATSLDPSDDALAALGSDLRAGVYRGSLDDVLHRVCAAAAAHTAEHVVRVTGDCPLMDPAVIDRVIGEHLTHAADYTSNIHPRTFPDGLDVEVVRFPVLVEADAEADLPSEREHVCPFLYHRPERYRLHSVVHESDLSRLRWVVDHAVDFEMVADIFARLHPQDPEFGMADVLELVGREPELFTRNAAIDPDEGWRRSVERDAAHRREQDRGAGA